MEPCIFFVDLHKSPCLFVQKAALERTAGFENRFGYLHDQMTASMQQQTPLRIRL